VTRVAVIVVNFNGGAMLRECLAALRDQSVPAARVLVMDNGSRDSSIADARAMYPWAEYHLLNDNLGFAKANNAGIALVDDCEWIGLINPDAFADQGWIAAFERRAREFPDVDVFASRMLIAQDPRLVDGSGDAYRVDGLAWPRYQGGLASALPSHPEEVFAPSAGAAFYRRRVLVEVGGFCERFFCYYEDVDLGFRLRLHGCRCMTIPDAVVRHMGSAISGGKASAFSVYHAHRNFVWTFVRNMPGKFFWLYLPAHIGANLASVALFIRKGMGGVILRAKWDAVKGLPQTFNERRSIQARRAASPRAVVDAMQKGNLLSSTMGRMVRVLRRAIGQG
jgi:GT2 family glycosyltransferase